MSIQCMTGLEGMLRKWLVALSTCWVTSLTDAFARKISRPRIEFSSVLFPMRRNSSRESKKRNGVRAEGEYVIWPYRAISEWLKEGFA